MEKRQAPLVIGLSLAVFGCAPTQTMHAPVGMPPQPSWQELQRDPVWLANCVVALEIAARKEAGAPVITNGPGLHQKWGRALALYLPDEAARAQRLATTRQEWADLLEDKSPEDRHEELDSMLGVCGAEEIRP
jgi:hypothetical protein